MPDSPVSALSSRHLVMVTPHEGVWLVWCVCGYDGEFATFDLAIKDRAAHISHTPLLVSLTEHLTGE